MSNLDRLSKEVDKIRVSSKNVRFETLEKILVGIGYTVDKSSGGSHIIFRKNGKNHVNIPYRKPIKEYYVESVIAKFDEYIKEQK